MNYDKWKKHEFSTGGIAGKDYLKFQNEMKKDLKRMSEEQGIELKKFTKNHYCFSAVLFHEKTKEYAYVSISDVRFFSNEWFNHVLVRSMQHEKDYTGRTNYFCAWNDVVKEAKNIMTREYRRKEKELIRF